MEQALADLIGPDLRVLFCGINPGMLSGELGLHFARPGNRFWKLLCAGGFTGSVLLPAEQHTLSELGIGITNLVGRATAAASELSRAELRDGSVQLEAKAAAATRCVAVLGLQAYRTAFRGRKRRLVGSPKASAVSFCWLLPNPSGLQAHYQLPEMTEMFSLSSSPPRAEGKWATLGLRSKRRASLPSGRLRGTVGPWTGRSGGPPAGRWRMPSRTALEGDQEHPRLPAPVTRSRNGHAPGTTTWAEMHFDRGPGTIRPDRLTGSTGRSCRRSSKSGAPFSPTPMPRAAAGWGSSSRTEGPTRTCPQAGRSRCDRARMPRRPSSSSSLDAWSAFVWELKDRFCAPLRRPADRPSGRFRDTWRGREPPLRVAFSNQVLFDIDHPTPMADETGREVDLSKSFTLEDSATEIRASRTRVGFADLRAVLDAAEIEAIRSDVDEAVGRARPDDRRSWWTTVDGRDVPQPGELPQRRFGAAGRTGRRPPLPPHRGPGGRRPPRRLDRLDGNGVVIKVPGSSGGLANLPWHRDCGMGGHPVKCPC